MMRRGLPREVVGKEIPSHSHLTGSFVLKLGEEILFLGTPRAHQIWLRDILESILSKNKILFFVNEIKLLVVPGHRKQDVEMAKRVRKSC